MLDETDIRTKLTDQMALALTALAEAGGDAREGGSSVEERVAVMCVIRNRQRFPRRFGDTAKDVCLGNNGKTWQFDCWRPGSGANHDRILQLAYLMGTHQPLMNPMADETLYLADGVLSGLILDRVNGATHYYAPKAMVPAGSKPAWVWLHEGQEIVVAAVVGDQRFYKGV